MSSFLRYTVLRFGLLVVVLAALALIGVRGVLLPALAVLISLPLSYVLLARQRNAFAADVERRVAERQERRTALRAEMAGEPAEDYNDEAYLTEEDLAAETAAPVEPAGDGTVGDGTAGDGAAGDGASADEPEESKATRTTPD